VKLRTVAAVMETVNETVNIVYLIRTVHHMSIYHKCRHLLKLIPALEQHTTKFFSFSQDTLESTLEKHLVSKVP